MKNIIRFFATFLRFEEPKYEPGELIWVNFNYHHPYRWYNLPCRWYKKRPVLCKFLRFGHWDEVKTIVVVPVDQELTVLCEKEAVMRKANSEECFKMIMEK